MTVYLFSGKDMYRQEERLQSLLKEYSIKKDDVSIFDASNAKTFRFDEALMACDTLSLFDEGAKKAVILKEPYFLKASSKTGGKESSKQEAIKQQRLSLLESYLKDPNLNTILIFYCHNFSADTRKKEYKLLSTYDARVVKFEQMKPWEFEKYVDTKLKDSGFRLKMDAKNELLERTANDTLKLHNAFVKMDLYGKKELTYQDIVHIVPINADLNIYRMSNAFVAKDLANTLLAKDEMLQAHYEYIAMISMLASRLRSLYNIKKLYDLGLSNREIMTRLHAEEWTIKKGLESCYHLSSKTLLLYLKELADLEQGIKSGRIEPKNGFEQFILKYGS